MGVRIFGHRQVDDRPVLLQPERYLIGAGSFAVANLVNHVAAPATGALFGVLFFPVGSAVYSVLNDCWKENTEISRMIKIALSLFAAIGAGFLMTTYVGGVALTMTQVALLTVGGIIATYGSNMAIDFLHTEFS